MIKIEGWDYKNKPDPNRKQNQNNSHHTGLLIQLGFCWFLAPRYPPHWFRLARVSSRRCFWRSGTGEADQELPPSWSLHSPPCLLGPAQPLQTRQRGCWPPSWMFYSSHLGRVGMHDPHSCSSCSSVGICRKKRQSLGLSQNAPWDIYDCTKKRNSEFDYGVEWKTLTSPARLVCERMYSWCLEDSLPADGDLGTCWSCTCCWPEATNPHKCHTNYPHSPENESSDFNILFNFT